MTKIRKTASCDLVRAALPGTQGQIMKATGLTQPTTARWLTFMRECGEAHVGAWVASKPGGPPQSVYHAGPGADVACNVRPLSNAEKLRRKHAPGAIEREERRRRADALAAPARRDPFTAAFFGPAGQA